MRVAIIGPNLNDQSKGTFHVHTENCRDRRNYGPDGRFGGEDDGWVVDAASLRDVVYAIYSDHLAETGENEAGQDALADEWVSDFWFAPCVPALPAA